MSPLCTLIITKLLYRQPEVNIIFVPVLHSYLLFRFGIGFIFRSNPVTNMLQLVPYCLCLFFRININYLISITLWVLLILDFKILDCKILSL